MPQTSITIQVDEEVKREAEALFAQQGLTLSSATNMLFQQVVIEKVLPFNFSATEPSAEAKSRLRFGEAIKDVQAQSVVNGTAEMTHEEINEIIAEARRETSSK